MSHELRTPLNAITLYSELLQENAQADGRDEDVTDLAKIRVASRHLLGLINGLLDLSKIEAGKMELEVETFDVRDTVEELIGTIDALVRQNGNTLTVTFDDDGRDDARRRHQDAADPVQPAQQRRQVHQRGRDLARHLALAPSTAWRCIEFVVTDTGIGLTDEQKARLFRPFVQADTSIARKYGGTGLGLALVWRFCELMGGAVTVDTPSSGGARFSVRLPVDVEAACGELAQPAA